MAVEIDYANDLDGFSDAQDQVEVTDYANDFDGFKDSPLETRESVYDDDKRRVIDAPNNLNSREFGYLSSRQVDREPSSNYFGFTNLAVKALPYVMKHKDKPMQLPRGAAAWVVENAATLVGGALSETGEIVIETQASPRYKKLTEQQKEFARVLGFESTFEGGRFKELGENLRDAGLSLMKNTEEFMDDVGLSRKSNDGMIVDVGGGFGSVGMSTTASILTRSATPAAIVYGGLQNFHKYKAIREAQVAGKMEGGALDAASQAIVFTIPEVAVEYLGGKFMLGARAATKTGKVFIRSLGEGFQEATQTGFEKVIDKIIGLTDISLSDAAKEIGYSGLIGFIVGVPVHTIVGNIEDQGKKRGVEQKEIEAIKSTILKATEESIEVSSNMMRDQTSPLTSDKEMTSQVKDIIKKFKNGEDIPLPENMTEEEQEFADLMADAIKFEEEKAPSVDTVAQEKIEAKKVEGRVKLINKEVEHTDVLMEALSNEIEEIQIKSSNETKGNEDTELKVKLKKAKAKLSELSIIRENLDNERGELLDVGVERVKIKTAKGKPKTVDIVQFLISKGGIVDAGGDIKSSGVKNSKLFRDSGLTLDRARELAAEAGYIDEDTDLNQLKDAVTSTLKGDKIYTREDGSDIVAFESAKEEVEMFNEARIQASDEIKARELSKKKRFTADDIDAIAEKSIERGVDVSDIIDEVELAIQTVPELSVRVMLEPEAAAKPRRDKVGSTKDVIVQARQLDNTKQRTLDLERGFRAGKKIASTNIKKAQNYITDIVTKSGLELKDKAKFIRAIKNIQTEKQFNEQLPIIQSRIANLLLSSQKSDMISKIEKAVKKVGKSKDIAIDYVQRINNLLEDITTTNPNEKTKARIQSSVAFLERNPDANFPTSLQNEITDIGKRPIKDISLQELTDLLESINNLSKTGKAKLKLIKAKRAADKRKDLEELRIDSVVIEETDLKSAELGEVVDSIDYIKNLYITAKNKAQRLNLNKNPMDVIIDILDGAKNYMGANSRIFKRRLDRKHDNYLNLREQTTRDVKKLADDLELTKGNYDRIGAWAALQQEGGKEKLIATGIKAKEIAKLEKDGLNEKETQMYELMREKLDSLRAALKEVMRVEYNKDFEFVKDYFPFMTDFSAMDGLEIQDMFGDEVPLIKAKSKDVKKGFTKSRALGKQKIRIDAMNIFLNHVDNATYLIEMGGAIKELSVLAESSEYKAMVGDLGQTVMTDWLDLLARKGNIAGRTPLDTLRKNAAGAVLAFKLSSAAIQYTSLATGASMVGGNYVFVQGVPNAVKTDWQEFMYSNMPEVRDRVGDDPNYMEIGSDTWVGKLTKKGFVPLQKLDMYAAMSVASGAYIKSVEARGGTVDFSKPDPVAIEYAQLMVRRSQSSQFAKDQPPIISQGKLTELGSDSVSFDKLLLQFQSFMLNEWSIIQHDFGTAVKEKDIKKAVGIATWLSIAQGAEILTRHGVKMAVAGAVGAAMPELPDFEDNVMTALGKVPFVSQIISAFGYGSIPVPAISLTADAIQSLNSALRSKKTETKAKHAVLGVLGLAGSLGGVPGMAQGKQLIKGATKGKKKKKKHSGLFK